MAIAILLIISIGISVFSLGEILVSKTRFANMADSLAFAGSTVQQYSMVNYQNIANLEPLVKISYNLGIALENLKEGAESLHKHVPGYDPTADVFADELTNIMGSYDSLVKKIDKNPFNPHFIDSAIYNELLNFYLSDAVIYAKNVEQQNLALDSNQWKHYTSLICPAETILQQGPVDGKNGTSPRFKWEFGLKNGKLIFRYVRRNGLNIEDATGGIFVVVVADSPEFMFKNLLPASTSTKVGKIISFSYSYPYTDTPDDVTYDPINLAFIELEFINLINSIRAAIMDSYKGKGNTSSSEKKIIKNLWNDMVDDYNGFLAFLDSNRFKAAFGINESVYKTNPVMGSLSALKLLNLSSFKTICQNKGLNRSVTEDQDTFYKSLTFKDIFSTPNDLRFAHETSIDRLITGRASLDARLKSLLNKIDVLDKNRASGNNIPAKLARIPAVVYENLNSSTLAPFLQVLTMVSDSINESYTSISNTTSLINLRSSYNYNSLKPSQAFWDLVPTIFNTPIIQLEGT
jgi:hypothetical protein